MAIGQHGTSGRGERQDSNTPSGLRNSAKKERRKTNGEHAAAVRARSIQEQKQLFDETSDRGSWGSNYTLLEMLRTTAMIARSLPMTAARKEVVRVWSGIDSRVFKLGQQLWSSPSEAVAPGNLSEMAKKETPRAPSKLEHPALFSQLGALYTEVSIAFATATGILPAKKRSACEAIDASANIAVVTQAKYLIDCLQPIGNRAPKRPNAVVLVIDEPTERVRIAYQKAFAKLGIIPPRDAMGSILYVRGALDSPNLREFPPKSTAQVFPTIYEALRKTHHQARQYTLEREAASELVTSWRSFADSSLPGWTSERALSDRLQGCSSERDRDMVRADGATRNQEIISIYTKLLERTENFLRKSIDPNKQDVAERITRMQQRLASGRSGAVNRYSLLPQADANWRRLVDRLDDIRIKRIYNSSDRDILEEKLRAEHSVVDTVHTNLSRYAKRITVDDLVFRGLSTRQRDLQRNINTLFSKLGLPRPDGRGVDKSLLTIKVRPFTTFRDAIEKYGRSLEQAAHPGGYQTAQDSLAALLLVTRAFKAHCILENARVALSRSDRGCAEVINKARQELIELNKRKSLFDAEIGLERSSYGLEFFKTCQKLQRQLDRIARADLELSRENLSNRGNTLTKSREEFRETARTRLQDFDFENFVRSLPLDELR